MAADVRPPAPHGASPDGPIGGATGAFDFLPPGFDWKTGALDTVRRHPVPCLLAAAAVGFYIGRYRGRTIAAAAAGLATNAIMREMNKAFAAEEF
jgi:hypothetical protein